jgi:hypothetical protein
MSSSARSMRRRRLTAHRPRRRRGWPDSAASRFVVCRGGGKRGEGRGRPGGQPVRQRPAAGWRSGSPPGCRGRNGTVPAEKLMTSRECETAISYPRARRYTDAGARGEALPGWLRRSTDRRLPASRLEDSQIQRAYPITSGPYCGNSLQL